MESLPKDVYEYMTQFGDDEDILVMLKVNKKFNKIINDDFFRRVLQRKYPLLLKFKKDDESYRDFYIKMVYYIGLLEERDGIPYIPIEHFNPEKYYKMRLRHRRADAMIYAMRAGRPDLAKKILDSGIDQDMYFTVINVAIEYNYLDLVKELIHDYVYYEQEEIDLDSFYYWKEEYEEKGNKDMSDFIKEYIEFIESNWELVE